MLLELNGVAIKVPPSLQFSKYNLTKSGRVASGLMTMDLIAKKRKFNFSYDVIRSIEMERILDIIDGNEMFFQIRYDENNVIKTATVYVGEITHSKFRTKDPTTSVWYWKDFAFNLIEQ